MSDKVIGGTPQGFQSMCTTCRSAHRIRGLNLQEVVYCKAGPMLRVSFPVAECSAYDDKRIPALYQMEQIAWQIQSRNRGATGFVGERELAIEISPPDPNRNMPSPQSPQFSGVEVEKSEPPK